MTRSDSARVSAELLLVLVMLAVALWLLGRMWSVVWPLVVGLLLTTLTWPAARVLRRRGLPARARRVGRDRAVPAGLRGCRGADRRPVASQSGQLTHGVVEGIQKMREWAAGPPLNIGDAQINKAFDTAVARARGPRQHGRRCRHRRDTVVNGLVTAVLALFLMFFFLKDGPRFLPWLSRQLPGRLAADVPTVSSAAGTRWVPSCAPRRPSAC
ncbi:Putative PurR-regulated permease PerM OS=Streptomyces violarus OX=67380 GN=FHS41_002600 PE=3 SV=1 [Streptomyces violarus]